MPSQQTPTQQLLDSIQMAYQHFNDDLFGGKLSHCMMSLQREKNVSGYFSQNRWASPRTNEVIHELAINPSYFAAVPVIEVLQTLAHEMVHFWQLQLGKPGRGRYHNVEFAQMMEDIGLMPSSTGKKGGKRVGDHMSEYPIPGGEFLTSSAELIRRGFALPWVDTIPVRLKKRLAVAPSEMASHFDDEIESDDDEQDHLALQEMMAANLPPEIVRALTTTMSDYVAVQRPENAKKKQKAKYTCACPHNVWGKPDLNIRCNECKKDFFPQAIDE